MARFARWHIWLGWLVGVPVVLWTLSGVVMVMKPIEEVRGEHLRIEPVERPALPGSVRAGAPLKPGDKPIVDLHTFVQRGRAVTVATHADGAVSRYDAATGAPLPRLDESGARAALAAAIRGGDRPVALRAYAAAAVPLDLRKPVSVWQATLSDGTHVYINRDSGEIEAVRTAWWRFYDFMWGLHIMDLQTREDSHNPFVIAFGTLALFGSALGLALLFRRRKARVAP
jgi:hypothetical protein